LTFFASLTSFSVLYNNLLCVSRAIKHLHEQNWAAAEADASDWIHRTTTAAAAAAAAVLVCNVEVCVTVSGEKAAPFKRSVFCHQLLYTYAEMPERMREKEREREREREFVSAFSDPSVRIQTVWWKLENFFSFSFSPFSPQFKGRGR